MVRKLKFHEQKLLKKVDFITWKVDNNGRENKILRRYKILKREEYTTYNKFAREIREVAESIAKLDKKDVKKAELTRIFTEKLYNMGLINIKGELEAASAVTASAFCRRRLPVVIVRNKMAENLKFATEMVDHGHIRVGPEVVKDPAFLVTRNLEDFVTWMDNSKIKKHVMTYNDMRDDFVL